MWINEQLSRGDTAEAPFAGRVTRVEGNRVDIEAHTRLTGVECVSAFGTAGLPAPGEEVVVLPGMEGYYCLGRLTHETAAGELELRSAGGGCLRLKADGSVVINGLVITREGALVQPAASHAE